MEAVQLTQPAVYANAEVRGKLREWKRDLARQYRIFERAYANEGRLRSVVDDFVRRTSIAGRRRAFDKLRKMIGPAPVLEGVRFDGGHPLAVWSLLKPRDCVAVDAPIETGLCQNCVAVNYLLAGIIPARDDRLMHGVSEGLWTLEVPDHALGRAIERNGNRLPGDMIREAHHNLLRLRQDRVEGQLILNARRQFLVRAGAGGFVCELRLGPDVTANNELRVLAFAHTWLGADQIHADQVLLADDGEPGHRLGDGPLLPLPLVRLIPARTPDKIECIAYSPGLPEMLSKPQGHA